MNEVKFGPFSLDNNPILDISNHTTIPDSPHIKIRSEPVKPKTSHGLRKFINDREEHCIVISDIDQNPGVSIVDRETFEAY